MIKKKVCPDCEGRGKIHFVSENHYEPCTTCWYKGYIEVPMTNADYIRDMNDEELSKFICGIYQVGNCDGLVNISEETNIDDFAKWLQEECKL